LIWWALQQLKSSDADVRAKAARTLGSVRNPKAVPALTKLLRDENSDVRLAAMQALGQIGHPSAAGPLTSTFNNPASKNNKKIITAENEVIAESLAAIGPPAVSSLAAALASEDAETRRWAAVALGRIKDARGGIR